MSITKQNRKLDLNKLSEHIYSNIEVLLDDLGLEYRQDGENIFMCCPIHQGSDNKTAVSISLDKRMWKCWTHNCEEEYGKDIFNFIRGVFAGEDWSFGDVLKYLCRLYNISKNTNLLVDPTPQEDFLSLTGLFKKHIKLVDKFENNIQTEEHSDYFESRGFLRSTLNHFGVKDCLDKNSKMYNRAIIPIYSNEEEIGYIARATKDYMIPKYLFSKGLCSSLYLYNYDKAIERARQVSALFIVEGQGDVWRLYEAGVTNAVGLFGKDISQQQKELLKTSGATKLIVMTDNDQAGREGRMKIQRELNRYFKLIYPPMPKKDVGEMSIERIQKTILPHVEGMY